MMPVSDITVGKQWRRVREEGALFRFSSGNTARVRNVPFDLFIKLGRIPDSLTGIVVAAMNGRGLNLPPVETLEDAMKNIEFLDAIARSAFVSPRIVDNPQGDDEISVEDLELEEKLELVNLLGLPARELERFCAVQNQHVASLDAQSIDSQPPIDNHEDWGVGGTTDGDTGDRLLDGNSV